MSSTPCLFSYVQVAVLVLLAILPFISATPHPSRTTPSRDELHLRDTTSQQRDALPPGWSSLGCYTDSPSFRTLTSEGFSDPTAMTVELCVNICQKQAHNYAGLENGTDCYCGNILTSSAVLTPSSDCSSNCVGNPDEICGGNNFLSLYTNGEPPQPQPTFVISYGSWSWQGCYRDPNDARLLAHNVFVQGGPYNNSVENCLDTCTSQGYIAAGMELAQECWCDVRIRPNDVTINRGNCSLACPGNSIEYCGGPNALLLYYNSDNNV